MGLDNIRQKSGTSAKRAFFGRLSAKDFFSELFSADRDPVYLIEHPVYLIEHPEASKFTTDINGDNPIEFSEIEKILREEGYQLGYLFINHVLIDARVPLSEFKDYLAPRDYSSLGKPADFQSISESEEFRRIRDPSAYRYRTIIRAGETTQGSVIGYSECFGEERDKHLTGMVGAYIEDKARYKLPYFAITNPESSSDVANAFKNQGAEVIPIKKK